MSTWRRGVVLFVVAWLAFDISTPFVPGAFQFDPGDSVEVVGTSNQSSVVLTPERFTSRIDAVPPPHADERIQPVRVVTAPVRAVRAERVGRPARDLGSALPPSDPA